MKININQINEALKSFEVIDNTKFKLKTAYKLSRINAALQEEKTKYENFLRDQIAQYAEKDENGNPKVTIENGQQFIPILPEYRQTYFKQIEELNNSLIDFPDIKFSFDDFGDITISITELQGLLPFIEESED